MLTPYDWQEGIGHRSSYVESKLVQAAPILAVSLNDGILLYTRKRQGRKLFEVYDRLAFGGIGLQSDLESVRMAALDFSSREGFARSEEDVTIKRVVTAVSAPIKRAFGDFGAAPVVLRSLFAELGATPDQDLFFTLDYDGDYTQQPRAVVVAGSNDLAARLTDRVQQIEPGTDIEAAQAALESAWREIGEDAPEAWASLVPEIALLDRAPDREERFRIRSGA